MHNDVHDHQDKDECYITWMKKRRVKIKETLDAQKMKMISSRLPFFQP